MRILPATPLRARRTIALVLALAAAGGARADSLPLWEAGLGVGAIEFPDYRGSDQYRTYVLPVPYFVYRGDVFKVDRDSARANFFASPDVQLDLSINGSVPVNSSADRAREGMPNLDPSLEVGPALDLTLLRSDDKKTKLELRLPVRTVEGSNFSHVENIGWISQPNLNVDFDDPLGYAGYRLGIESAALFADRRYLQYFYGVAPAYANAERPSYEAHGGYAGSQLILALSRRYTGMWVGGVVKWDTLRGAAFEDSPLVKRREFVTAGFAVSWILGRSATLVEADH